MNHVIPLFDSIAEIDEPNTYISAQLQKFSKNGIDDVFLCYELAIEFLMENTGSEQTFKTYRAEIEKFLVWCWQVKSYKLIDINKNRLRNYIEFIQKPPAELIGRPTNCRYKYQKDVGVRVPNPKWRPFVNAKKYADDDLAQTYTFNKQSIQVTLSAISKFYEHLNDEDYCEKNPAAILKRKMEFKQTQVLEHENIKYFTLEQWRYVVKALDSAFANVEPEIIERNKFLILFMYSLYLRITEVEARAAHTPLMTDIQHINHVNAIAFRIPISKGYKGRNVPVPDTIINAFKKYRETLNLPPLPGPDETIPLFPHIVNGKPTKRALKQRWMREIIQSVFHEAADLMSQDGKEIESGLVRNATPHWLRHTGISHDLNYGERTLVNVMHDAGHASIDTTSKYLHATVRERYESAKGKPIIR